MTFSPIASGHFGSEGIMTLPDGNGGRHFLGPGDSMSRTDAQESHRKSGGLLQDSLAAETEAFDDLLVFLLVTLLDVVEQLAALGDEGEESAAG